MTAAPPASPLPSISFGALLGVTEGEDAATWSRLRSRQLIAARRFAPLLLAAHALGIATILTLFSARVPLTWLGGWGLLATAVAAGGTIRRVRHPVVDGNSARPDRMRAAAPEGLATGLVWAVAPLLFAARGDAVTIITLGALLTALSAAAALAPLLLPALLFIGTVSVATAAALWLGIGALPATAALLAGALLGLLAIGRTRAQVQVLAAALLLAERDETVSMLLRDFEDSDADWLWETDASRRVVRASARFALACGVDAAAINGQPLLQVLAAGPAWESGNLPAGLHQLADKLKNRESFRDLVLPVAATDPQRWWEIAASPRYDVQGVFCGFRGVGSDVTEQRASADRINRMARFDTLTGLPNRLFVNEELACALAEAEQWRGRCAFMMIDLDRFKAVNDTLGHPIGDRLLGRVSERLGQLMSDNDLIGRLGGDEFAVVVRDAGDAGRLERLARTIIDTLSRPYEVDQHTLYIGASVGIATSPRDGRTAEMLIRSADLALYRSKDQGGGVFHAYEPQLHAEAEERRVLEVALRKALENGELHLNYQPVVDARAGQLRGFEALLRWQHPTLGLIPPAKFIPIAEEARLIAPIGEWVVRTACAEAAGWPSDIRIAVNVSPEQLHNPHFVTVIASALAQSGLPAERLDLEVTESVFLRESTGAIRVLEQILDLGVGLSLDDFGTGYSSLGYLSSTRFSSIKIDRSFVQAASAGTVEAIAIIRAVIAMADSLGLATTAEGVETEAELRMVQELGCKSIQGFYFGRPLPVAEARSLALRDRVSQAA